MSGEFVGLIPEEFIDPKKKREFLLWLLALPVDPWTKKYIYMDWAKLVGIAIDEKDVELLVGQASITWG
jgi:hypothetical protein